VTPGLAIAVDVGGTFTDVSLVDVATGHEWTHKTPTTPDDPSRGFLEGLRSILEIVGGQPDQVTRVLHGTTIATNAVLEFRGAPTGLLTTAGFRHVLEIGRHDAPAFTNLLAWNKPIRPVKPRDVLTVAGRIDARGLEIEPLDEEMCRLAAREFKGRGILSIAVCLLNAHLNPSHELTARSVLADEHPEATYTLSSDVLPVLREYERSMATVLNSYVRPVVAGYLGRLSERLEALDVRVPLHIMRSNGGVAGATTVLRQPASTALSGPAAGAIGATEIAAQAGIENAITLDVGGTSADIALVSSGSVHTTTHGLIGHWPLATPMLDIQTIGAGGGSIAKVTPAMNLVVGPESAGSVPGPASYSKGGLEPCLTDAQVVLGRLRGDLADGGIRLDADLAWRAVEERVAKPLGISVLDAAAGIVDLADNHMVGAIRVLTIERGIDPREYALIPFGGAGPLHGASVARLLGIRTWIVPPSPGVLSAHGLHAARVRHDFVRQVPQSQPSLAEALRVIEDLREEAHSALLAEGLQAGDYELSWHADLRYQHQIHELTVDLPVESLEAAGMAVLYERFAELHEQLYTYRLAGHAIEMIAIRVVGLSRLIGDGSRALETATSEVEAPSPAPLYQADVWFSGSFHSTPFFERVNLPPGARLEGPAIVGQMDSTTLVLPGQEAAVDSSRNLVVSEKS